MPLDTRLLSEAVIELNISRKNVGIYPPGHVQITKSIERAFEILLRLFEVRPEMTLGVAKDTLLVGQDYLDKKNPVYRDFALSMSHQGIAAVTFQAGLTKEELVRFHRVLTTKPDEIAAAGGIEKAMADASIEHVKIKAIHYGSFHATEEQVILTPQLSAEKRESRVWEDFVAHLADNTLAGRDAGVSLQEQESIDPAELARLLNERKVEPAAAVQSYDRIISSYLRGAAEKKQLTREQSTTLKNLNALLKDLGPELRKQFLSVAFERVSAAGPSRIEDIDIGFTDDMVIDMLAQANAEGREISPTLAGLISKLAKSQGGAGADAPGGREQRVEAAAAPEIPAEQMQKLFDREQYEEYVSADYDAMLKRMSEAPPATGDFPLEEYQKELEDGRLDFQIGRALLAFMEEDLEEEDYKEFALKVTAIVPGFLDTGNFELIVDISDTLRRHGMDKHAPGIRKAAEEARAVFSNPAFIEKALRAFEIWMREKGQEAAGLIRSLGPGTIPGLMDIFGRDESYGGRRVLFNLLCLLGEPAVQEAQKRLRDPRAYYVINLLLFLRRAGAPAVIASVKPLLRHQNQSVRMEALSTLLKFKDPEAVRLLREALRSEDPDIASKGISLAGLYRVAEVTEDILARIKRVILFEADYGANAEIIKALGEIGDARAVPDLERLARANWTLHPQRLLDMKETLFESLGRYPKASIQSLIRIGERLSSDKIKKACKKLAERQ